MSEACLLICVVGTEMKTLRLKPSEPCLLRSQRSTPRVVSDLLSAYAPAVVLGSVKASIPVFPYLGMWNGPGPASAMPTAVAQRKVSQNMIQISRTCAPTYQLLSYCSVLGWLQASSQFRVRHHPRLIEFGYLMLQARITIAMAGDAASLCFCSIAQPSKREYKLRSACHGDQ